MKNLNKIVATTLMAGTILGVPSACADNEATASLAPAQSVEVSSTESDVIVPFTTNPVIMNETISNTKYQNSFNIPPG